VVGGLLADEAAIAASEYLKVGDWPGTRKALASDNLLHSRARSSGLRVGQEVVRRMRTLSDAEVKYLAHGPCPDRRHLMWAAFARCYAFVAEFAEEVLRDKYLLGDMNLSREDFERFVSNKSLWHVELDEVKPSTRRRLRNSLFLAMRQAGFLTDEGVILPALLSTEVAGFLNKGCPTDIRFFPTSVPTGGGT
jgi:hypothetical protein